MCVSVCVDGFNMDVLVRVHGCVSLHFPTFYFSCFLFLFLFFARFVVVIFRHFFHDLNVHDFFLRFFCGTFFFRHFHFCHFSCFVILVVTLFFFKRNLFS